MWHYTATLCAVLVFVDFNSDRTLCYRSKWGETELVACIESTWITQLWGMECVPSILSILLGAANCYSGWLLRPLHLWRLALRMSKPSGFKITLTIVHKSGVQEDSGKEKGHHCNKEALHTCWFGAIWWFFFEALVAYNSDFSVQDSADCQNRIAWFSSCNVCRIFDNSTSAWLSLSLEQRRGSSSSRCSKSSKCLIRSARYIWNSVRSCSPKLLQLPFLVRC